MTNKANTKQIDRREKNSLDFLCLRPAGFSQEFRDGLVATHSRVFFI